MIQNPNFFGQFEDVTELAEAVHAAGALLIVVADPISLGLFQPPGEYGADIVVADGQALGLPPSFGGPHLGIMAVKKAHIRKLAGRLVGATVDVDGTTLQAVVTGLTNGVEYTFQVSASTPRLESE